jgi:hypothetical protein
MKQNIFNDDFQDFIKALNFCEVEYMLVGGYATILYGHSRNTGDMDIWVNQNLENYSKIVRAFHRFGMPVYDFTKENFLDNKDIDVFSYGRPPVSIDLMLKVKGLDFDEAFLQSSLFEFEGFFVRVVQLQDLIKAKIASGRPKDLDDILHLKLK